MIGKIIGAVVGDRVAKQTRGVGGPAGAALGVVAATAIRRLSLPAMVVLGAGGYFAKKHFDKRNAESEATTPPATSTAPHKAKSAKSAKSAKVA